MTSEMSQSEIAALQIAAARTGDRSRLLEAVVDICETTGGAKSDRGQELLESIFLDLVSHAEREVRLRLASRLASAPWAPSGLINALALDDIDIARPVIAKSPVLKDRDLIFLLAAATLDHQIEVARRPGLPADVAEAIVDQADPIVLTALAGNGAADIREASLAKLVSLSERLVSLRAPLSRHPRLNADLAGRLYAWVGAALRSDLETRFTVDRSAFADAIKGAVAESVSGGPPVRRRRPGDGDPAELEQRLIAKMHASGQLRAGFLLRALRQRKLTLFAAGLASLSGEPYDTVRQALALDDPLPLAFLVVAVGIDRSVFPSLITIVRSLNQGRPGSGDEDVGAAFEIQDRAEALGRFRERMGTARERPREIGV